MKLIRVLVVFASVLFLHFFVINAKTINTEFCGVTDVAELPFLQTFIESCYYGKIYSFTMEGQEYIYVPVTQTSCFGEPPIADIGSYLFDCQGNIVCLVGGFTIIEDQCSFQGIDFQEFIIPENVVWCAKKTNFCGVTDVAELPFLQTFIDDCHYEEIYSFTMEGQEYIYVNLTRSACPGEPLLLDLGSYLYDCQGNGICSFGGFTPEEAQCSFQGIEFQEFIIPENLIWCSEPDKVLLRANIYLQNAYLNSPDDLMNDDLRTKGVIPLEEPFTALPGFNHVNGGGGETIDPSVLEIGGQNAIIDWVLIELHKNSYNPNVISLDDYRATKSALLQRDGDIVDTDGVSDVTINAPEGDYYINIRHRNHLGATTKDKITFTKDIPTESDFSTIETFGQEALTTLSNGKKALWGGSIGTDKIVFQGPENLPNAIFFDVLTDPENEFSAANYISTKSYSNTDLNMDGATVFQGLNNDVNVAFFTILQHPLNTSLSPNFIIYEQKP